MGQLTGCPCRRTHVHFVCHGRWAHVADWRIVPHVGRMEENWRVPRVVRIVMDRRRSYQWAVLKQASRGLDRYGHGIRYRGLQLR